MSTNTNLKKNTRKRQRNEKNWKENKRKISKNEGREYMSVSGKTVLSKEFEPVETCCLMKCFSNVDNSIQKNFFDSFWKSAGDYKTQNYILSGLMKMETANEIVQNQRTSVAWEYYFHFLSYHFPVCQKFLCHLLKLKKGRFTTIQKKLLKNESLEDKRGAHSNRVVRLSEDVKKMIYDHCMLIPHSESHYNFEKSSLLYFDNSDLSLCKLYELFVNYYKEENNGDSNPPVAYSTYAKYFNHNLNFTFTKPRTDVCNFCFEHQKADDNGELQNHKNDVENYQKLKKAMLSDKDALCLEFNFGQNLPLPKIPVSEQFYKRLIWLHVFNVHVFGDHKRSYMYFFLEGKLKKGANTVSNFLFDAIKRELELNYYNKIYLFSDNCGGQNKNHLIICFLSLLSKHLEIEIQHVFPVRGHSYCSCDRNFGMYGQKKKKIEVIETADEYYQIVESARNPPFIIIKEKDIDVKNFEAVISNQVNIPKNLHIRDAVKFTYFPNSHVHIFNNYNSQPVDYLINSDLTFHELLKTPPANPIGISKEKLQDVRTLLRYLSPKGKLFFDRLIEKAVVKENKKNK